MKTIFTAVAAMLFVACECEQRTIVQKTIAQKVKLSGECHLIFSDSTSVKVLEAQFNDLAVGTSPCLMLGNFGNTYVMCR